MHAAKSLLGLFSLLTAVAALPAPMPTPVRTPSLLQLPSSSSISGGADPTATPQPGIPTASSAKTQLAGLTVATPVDDGTYDRDLFPTWDDQGDNCNTR